MIHEIHVAQTGATFSYRFVDGEKAKAAYEALTAALREYKLFTNDREDVIEIDTNDGKAAFKLRELRSVSIGVHDPAGEYVSRIFQIEKAERDLRESLGLPNKT